MTTPRAPRPAFEHRPPKHGLIGPFGARQIAGGLVIVVAAVVLLLAVTAPLGRTGQPGPRDPKPTPSSCPPPRPRACGRATSHPSSRVKRRTARRSRSPTSRGSRPPRRPARQGGLDQLLRVLVPAVPGRDAGPARHRITLQGPGRRVMIGISVQEPSGIRRRRVRREVRPGWAHDRSRPDGRHLPAVRGVRPADAGVHRPGRHRPHGPPRADGLRVRGGRARRYRAGADRVAFLRQAIGIGTADDESRPSPATRSAGVLRRFDDLRMARWGVSHPVRP